MRFTGVLKRMKVELDKEVQYYLDLPGDFLHINSLLDKNLNLNFKGYQCLSCEQDKRIFRQGFCYDCFYKSPMAGDWIMKPELSTAHLDKEDRDLEFEKRVQLKPHIVYLANSGDVKVGITRKTQVPTRWIDQGAHEAISILETPNRYLAGVAEVALKEHIADKTNWRNMLKNNIKEKDLFEVQQELKTYLPEEVAPYYIESPNLTKINFPVLEYPTKVKSLNFKKQVSYSGKLKGIKGQYLIFEDNTVFNVRSNSGFVIDLEILR